MRTYDFSPLFRSTIGFDRLFTVLDEVNRAAEETYPPYNIERLDENRFQISVALAGFTPDEIALTAEQNVLTLEGKKPTRTTRSSCIAASPPAISSASSLSPTMSRSRARGSRTACCSSNCSARSPRP